MNVNDFSNIANIITCISFFVYISGIIVTGIIRINEEKKRKYEMFVWNPSQQQIEKYLKIHKETIDDEMDKYHNCEPLLISTNEMIINFNAYYIIFKSKNFKKYDKEKRFCHYDRITKSECILLDTPFPEGIPAALLTWETLDYMKATWIPTYDGRDGNDFESISYKHTLKSVFYYIFKN